MTTTILLTREGLEHKYVANHLASAGLIDAIIIEEAETQNNLLKWQGLVRRHGYSGLLERGLLRCWDYWGGPRAARATALRKLLGENANEYRNPEIIRRVNGINGAECIRHLKDINPDIILVYGTSVISSHILSFARESALNMHTGISPYYRGTDCAFWPLYNNDLQTLGATVHECTAALDGGRVFGRTWIELSEDDDIEAVFARCVIAGAALYSSVIKAREWLRPEAGEPQDLSVGRVYRSTMRNLRAELSLRRRVRGGLIRDHVSHIKAAPEEGKR